MTFPDYTTLGVAGLIAATLAVGLKVVWTTYQSTLKELLRLLEVYTKLLVDLTVVLNGLKQAIEAQEKLLRDGLGDVQRH